MPPNEAGTLSRSCKTLGRLTVAPSLSSCNTRRVKLFCSLRCILSAARRFPGTFVTAGRLKTRNCPRPQKSRGPAIRLQKVFGAHIASCKDGYKRRRSRGLFHVRPSLGFFAFHQTHGARNLKSELASSFNRLHGGGAGGANVVDDDHARALFAEALDALAGPVLLFRLAH